MTVANRDKSDECWDRRNLSRDNAEKVRIFIFDTSLNVPAAALTRRPAMELGRPGVGQIRNIVSDGKGTNTGFCMCFHPFDLYLRSHSRFPRLNGIGTDLIWCRVHSAPVSLTAAVLDVDSWISVGTSAAPPSSGRSMVAFTNGSTSLSPRPGIHRRSVSAGAPEKGSCVGEW